jgi:hypothetical protein
MVCALLCRGIAGGLPMPIPTEPIGSIPRPADLLAAMHAHPMGKISWEQLPSTDQINRLGSGPPRFEQFCARLTFSQRRECRSPCNITKPREPGSMLINQSQSRGVQLWCRYCECRLLAGNAGIGEHGHGIELSGNLEWFFQNRPNRESRHHSCVAKSEK